MPPQALISQSASLKLATGASAVILGFFLLRAWRKRNIQAAATNDAESTDPGLLKKNTTFETYTTTTVTYPRIRTFFHPHPQAAKLPIDIPLLVFVHGLGGSTAQFAPLLTSLSNAASCLSIDLPGCGLSDFKPDDLKAYTTIAFAELISAAVQRFRAENQHIVFVGHSMGCSIAALLASSTSPLQHLLGDVTDGMIAICPKAAPPTPDQIRLIKRLRFLSPSVFDLIRLLDNIGGINSASVTRFVGKDADVETRKLQYRFNKQSKSAVFLRYLIALSGDDEQGRPVFPGEDVWTGVNVPLFLVAAESDTVNPPTEVKAIATWLTPNGTRLSISDQGNYGTFKEGQGSSKDGSAVPAAAGDAALAIEQLTSTTSTNLPNGFDTSAAGDVVSRSHTSTHRFALKTTIFPEPASHGLLYATSTVRVLSGLIQNFIASHVDNRLDLGWQLQHLTTSGKWDVKNLAKWQKVLPCTEPIGGVFRAMKTMREVDETHNPTEFVNKYGYRTIPDGVAMVVDISHESPVYDPKGLEAGGIEYHKFPTVSKLPPSDDEVSQFINLIDHLRESPKLAPATQDSPTHATIGVHCHYGYNRTGFLLCCYMVERLKYRLQDAVDEFAQRKPPGIKHEHFVNELFVRYAVSMQRRGTIVG